jgi:hypothetical protein
VGSDDRAYLPITTAGLIGHSGAVPRPTRAEWIVFIIAVLVTCFIVATAFSVRPI